VERRSSPLFSMDFTFTGHNNINPLNLSKAASKLSIIKKFLSFIISQLAFDRITWINLWKIWKKLVKPNDSGQEISALYFCEPDERRFCSNKVQLKRIWKIFCLNGKGFFFIGLLTIKMFLICLKCLTHLICEGSIMGKN